MIRTLALSAAAAMGLFLLPGQIASTSAAPALAPKFSTPQNAVEQVRRGGGGGFRGGGFRGGRGFHGGRGVYRGGFYGGRGFRGGRHYAYNGYRRGWRGRGWRNGIIIGAGIPFVYGAYGYSNGCGYYYRMWQRTGSSYWRRQYRDCGYW